MIKGLFQILIFLYQPMFIIKSFELIKIPLHINWV